MLAELAPAAGERTLDVTRGAQPFVWLETAEKAPRDTTVERLAGLAALHRDERILHRGWGFLAGRAEVDGKVRRIRLPLLSQPVRLDRSLLAYKVVPAGDLEVTPLVEDRELAAALEAAPGLATPGWLEATGSRSWLQSVAGATGFTVDRVLEHRQRIPAEGLHLIAAPALFVVRDVFGVGLADSLRSWAGRELGGTALAAIYGAGAAPAGTGDEPAGRCGDPVISPLPLTGPQRQVVVRARSEPVTVVSGAPGSGKSHTVVAAALEVVDRGGSVLVATQSPHAAEVLARLLSRYPGPPPVLFGSGHAALEAELTAGAGQGVPLSLVRSGRERVQAAAAAVRRQQAEIRHALAVEAAAASLPDLQADLPRLSAIAPGAFDGSVDLTEIRRLLDAAGAGGGWTSPPGAGNAGAGNAGAGNAGAGNAGAGNAGAGNVDGGQSGGWWGRWRAKRARRKAYRLAGAADDVPASVLVQALTVATAQRAAAQLAATGGTDLGAPWAALHRAEAELRTLAGAAMRDAARSSVRWTPDARRAAGALATALRAGRNRRRELLARMEAAPLVGALPLWIGTVADVEDLLPPEPGLFDLVVIDEASHVDQIRAAPVLARARRALIVGDPRQLRFVSFVSDVDVTQVLDRHGADERLDVRRVSTYDLAAASAPATWLAEHHRSVPHLIDFPARRFYGDRVSVMTRTPPADATDAVDVVHVQAAELVKGVNEAEVEAALKQVERLAAAGVRGIGVVSPFRAQAEALEAALLAALPAERIGELRLRVGTVHAFQGSEAEVVIVSLALLDGDPPSRRRFVTDAQLFNVMVTRARRRLIVLTSLTRPAGLLGDYLEHAEEPRPVAPAPVEPGGWAGELAAELRRLDVEVRAGYRVGPWIVDLCIGGAVPAVEERGEGAREGAVPAVEEPGKRARASAAPAVAERDAGMREGAGLTGGGQFVGVLCAVHPDGPEVHAERQAVLHRAGWRLVDAFPSRWQGDVRRAALELAAAVGSGRTPA
nr:MULTISPECIES: ATP-binding protein [unclassified Actinoplanes]